MSYKSRNASEPEVLLSAAGGPWSCPSCGAMMARGKKACKDCGQRVRYSARLDQFLPNSASGISYPQVAASRLFWEVILTLFVGVGVLSFVVPRVRAAREAGRSMTCQNNLKQIGLAVLDFAASKGSYPAAYLKGKDEKPAHSWRVLILPYLNDRECQELYAAYSFSEPWNGPHNRLLASRMPRLFRCPSDHLAAPEETNYMVVVGPGTLFPGDVSHRPLVSRRELSESLLLVEVAGTGVNWMEPKDLREDQLDEFKQGGTQGIGGRHVGGSHVGMADGSVRTLREPFSPATLRILADVEQTVLLPDSLQSSLSYDFQRDYLVATAVRPVPEGVCFLGFFLLLGVVTLRVLCSWLNRFAGKESTQYVRIPGILRAIVISVLPLLTMGLGTILSRVAGVQPPIIGLLASAGVTLATWIVGISFVNKTSLPRSVILGSLAFVVTTAGAILPFLAWPS